MRILLAILLLLTALGPDGLMAQDSPHIAVETSTLVVDEVRLRRLGIDGVMIAIPDSGSGVAGRAGGNVLVGGRLGGLEVAAWLDLVRRERLVERESTQQIVVLSGSTARIASQQTVVGPFGHSASAGPELWVEPVALQNGQVRLRVWSAVGQLRTGAFGTIWQEVPVEGSTEVVVPSGTPLVIASTGFNEESTERGMLSRSGTRTAGRAWIVVTARIVDDPTEAFPMPAGIPEEWLRSGR